MFEDHSTELLKFVLFLLLYAAGQHKTYEVYIVFLFLCSGVVGTGLAVLSKYRIVIRSSTSFFITDIFGMFSMVIGLRARD